MTKTMESLTQQALDLHRKGPGKLKVEPSVQIRDLNDLSLAYSPGVAEPCRRIHQEPSTVYDYTIKKNLVAVVTNGSAVLGLGSIGPEAALPVMEGKCVLFKTFADIDAFPICLQSKDVDHFVETVKTMAPTFGGINLEDIAAPDCFEIEKKLADALNIPVFHDDQHGTAIVVLAGVMNALKRVRKDIKECKIVINGCGAAGISIARLLRKLQPREIVVCDSQGPVFEGRQTRMNAIKREIARWTNGESHAQSLSEALAEADLFIGVSKGGVLKPEWIRRMKRDPVIFALANPEPEVWPEEAFDNGAAIIATGRSDYPNQINNVLAFPGIFRGALNAKASAINDDMKLAAAEAIAGLVSELELSENRIVPSALDNRVVDRVSQEVIRAAIASGVARHS